MFIDMQHFSGLKSQITFITASYDCIAKSVKNYDQVKQLAQIGFHYFCGDFIEAPRVIEEDTISTNKVAIINLMAALMDLDLELDKVTKLIIAESILSYKLIKFINSPAYRIVNEIRSVQDALVRFGYNNLKRWVMMLALCSPGKQRPSLIKMALQRAIMCEKLSMHLNVEAPDKYYTAGLLSMLDVFLNRPLEGLLREVKLAEDVVEAILEDKGHIGEVLKTVRLYQQGNTSANDDALTNIFMESLKETNEIMSSLGL